MHSHADAGQYDSIQFPSDVSNSTQPNIPLPSAMSLDLPLIPDVPAEQAGPSPFSQAAPYSIPNPTSMPPIGNNYQTLTTEVRTSIVPCKAIEGLSHIEEEEF